MTLAKDRIIFDRRKKAFLPAHPQGMIWALVLKMGVKIPLALLLSHLAIENLGIEAFILDSCSLLSAPS